MTESDKKIRNIYSITTAIEKLSREEFENNLRDFLYASRPSRGVGMAGHLKAREYLEKQLKSLNSNYTNVTVQEFIPDVASAGKMYEEDFNREILSKYPATDPNFKRWKGFTLSMLKALNNVKNINGKNFIWEKKGTERPNDVIILTANYDTLNHDSKNMLIDLKTPMPGADNNATGVSALISMAQIFNQLNLPVTVRIVFLDFEEYGFLGSKAYVNELKKNSHQNIIGVLNLVMLGNDTKIKDTEKRIGNMKAYIRDSSKDAEESKKDLAFANSFILQGKKMYPQVDFAIVANGFNSSSHIRFWEEKIPAICFTQNWDTDFNPRYHTSDDFFETLNMNTYLNSFRQITAGLVSLIYGVVK